MVQRQWLLSDIHHIMYSIEQKLPDLCLFFSGDSRFYNNIFVQQEVHPVLRKMEEIMGSDGNGWDDCCVSVGLMRYNGYQTEEEWKKEFGSYCGMGSEPSDRYYMHLPVWAEGNVYYNGAKSWEKENSVEDTEHKIELSLREKRRKMDIEDESVRISSAIHCRNYQHRDAGHGI